jgi:hypothetical protein
MGTREYLKARNLLDILMNLTDEEGESEIILIDNRSKKYFLINGVELSRDLITDDKTLIINISEE